MPALRRKHRGSTLDVSQGSTTPPERRKGPKIGPGGRSLITWNPPTFLEKLRDLNGNFLEAARQISMSPQAIYEYMRRHPEFRKAVENIREAAREVKADAIEDKALEIAAEGYFETTVENNRVTKRVHKIDPKTTLGMLDRLRPERFHIPARIEHTGEGGGPIIINFNLSDTELELEAEDAEYVDVDDDTPELPPAA